MMKKTLESDATSHINKLCHPAHDDEQQQHAAACSSNNSSTAKHRAAAEILGRYMQMQIRKSYVVQQRATQWYSYIYQVQVLCCESTHVA